MPLGANIRFLRERKSLTLEELSQRSEVEIGTISALEQRDSERSKYAGALAKAFGVPVEILTGSEHDLLKYHENNGLNINVIPAHVGTRSVPIINYIQAGNWREICNGFDAQDYLLTDLELGDGAFALEIKGDSMEPVFREGDRIIVDPNIPPRPGDFVVAKNGNDEATFKQFKMKGYGDNGVDVFELVPLNDNYAPLRSDKQQIDIVGVMIEHRRYRCR